MTLNSIYLAYPIDQRDPSASMVFMYQQAEQLKQMLTNDYIGVNWVFDPGDAFKVNPAQQPVGSLAAINRFAASQADGVVAFAPANVPTFGVPMEIDRAIRAGKPVAVLSDAKSYMLEYGDAVFRVNNWQQDDLDEVLNWAKNTAAPDLDQSTPLPVQFLADTAFMPSRTYGDDAGLDLYCSQDTIISPGKFVDIPCAIAIELPEWSWAMVTGRSSALRKKGLLVHTGVIDSGYRGAMFAGAWNLTDKEVWVRRGERIAQLITFVNQTKHFEPVAVDHLNESIRGKNGFGSSGS